MTEVPLRHPPGHFYSPIPDPEQIWKRRLEIFDRTVTELPGVQFRQERQEELVLAVREFYDDLPFEDDPGNGLRYGYKNDQFSYADGVFLYGLLRHIKPQRVIEVGSGFSSALMLDVNEHSLGGSIDLTFIEPFPKRLNRLLTEEDRRKATLIEKPVQDVPMEVFDLLTDGDILFIDSTHVSKTGSDVNHLFFNVLPRLAVGVWVHLHDIHYPFEYPETWVEQGYAWNEAYLLRAFLMYNQTFQIQLFVTQAELQAESWFQREMPLCMKDPGGSIWLRRVE